jgi:hypothetical protein
MKDVYEILRQKELELVRVRKEVDALRLAAPLVSGDREVATDMTLKKPLFASSETQQSQRLSREARGD